MSNTSFEVADIFNRYGEGFRQKKGHLSLDQLEVMSAIERCRTAALGGHVLLCENCGQFEIFYNSCRNRHCPKCQATAAKRWLIARQQDLLQVEYYHVVFTLPAVCVISPIKIKNRFTLSCFKRLLKHFSQLQQILNT